MLHQFYTDIVLVFVHALCTGIISLQMDWWLGCKIPNLLTSMNTFLNMGDGMDDWMETNDCIWKAKAKMSTPCLSLFILQQTHRVRFSDPYKIAAFAKCVKSFLIFCYTAYINTMKKLYTHIHCKHCKIKKMSSLYKYPFYYYIIQSLSVWWRREMCSSTQQITESEIDETLK